MSGSSDLYSYSGRQPHASINFVTCHDGFTLTDLVSYNEKHNLANAEDNRDGDPNNLSWNMGIEGPTVDPVVADLRRQQRRNFLFTLFVSIGVPMLSGGDEIGRSQLGNNNAYCHDSELTWTPWSVTPDDQAFYEFVRRLIALRASQPVLRRRTFLSGRRSGATDVLWLRPDGREMKNGDWADVERRTLGVLFDGDAIPETDTHGRRIVGETLLILLNAGAGDVGFVLPQRKGRRWDRLIDTAEPEVTSRIFDGGALWRLVGRSAAVFRNL